MRGLLLGVFLAVALSRAAWAEDMSAAEERVAGLPPGAMAGLSPADQDWVRAVYHRTLAGRPDLKTEADVLAREDPAEDSSPAGQAAKERQRSFQIKLRQAMLKEDPLMAGLFAKIDVYVSETRAKSQAVAPVPAAPAAAPAKP